MLETHKNFLEKNIYQSINIKMINSSTPFLERFYSLISWHKSGNNGDILYKTLKLFLDKLEAKIKNQVICF